MFSALTPATECINILHNINCSFEFMDMALASFEYLTAITKCYSWDQISKKFNMLDYIMK